MSAKDLMVLNTDVWVKYNHVDGASGWPRLGNANDDEKYLAYRCGDIVEVLTYGGSDGRLLTIGLEGCAKVSLSADWLKRPGILEVLASRVND